MSAMLAIKTFIDPVLPLVRKYLYDVTNTYKALGVSVCILKKASWLRITVPVTPILISKRSPFILVS